MFALLNLPFCTVDEQTARQCGKDLAPLVQRRADQFKRHTAAPRAGDWEKTRTFWEEYSGLV
jgi:hypothetical protein